VQSRLSPEEGGAVLGLNRNDFDIGFLSFKNFPIPWRVPPLPTPATKISTSPFMSSRFQARFVNNGSRIVWIGELVSDKIFFRVRHNNFLHLF